jgi:hypothetical protein
VKYSNEVIAFIRRLTEGDVALAIEEYRQHSAKRGGRKARKRAR